MMRRAYVPTPEGLSLVQEADQTIIRRPWFDDRALAVCVLVAIGDGFLILVYSKLLSDPPPDSMSGLFYGVSLVPAALGVLSTYYVVACFTNRTSIEISAAHLRVSSGPLPWIGNISLGAEDFTDIIVVPRPATGLHMGSFSIWSVDDRKWRRRLIWFLPEKRQADFIAQQIAQRWGLKEPSQH